MRLAAVVVASVALSPSVARADYVIVEPDHGSRPRDANGPDTLFLNRCVGGCTITKGGNDARTNQSSIPSAQTSTLSEFQYTNELWDAVVACVRDTYRPYAVDVVTEEPTAGDYVEVMVAGFPSELGLANNTLGIAPMASDCSSQVNWIAFAFANAHGTNPVLDLCATAAHEAGHVYGLDHEFDCKDPMTYLVGCGQKYFLNREIECGEFEDEGPRQCRCTGATQNSHLKLTTSLGVGELPPPPEVAIPYPTDGTAVIDGFAMFGEVVEARIVDRVEFWLNGWPWGTVPGRRDGTTYQYSAPGELPDGVIDVEIRAYNDLELMGSATVTVTKGAPCTSADTCLDGQACNEGRCAWPEPTGANGDTCAIDADCVSRRCETDGEHSICTTSCTPGLAGGCEEGYQCLAAGDGGVCWPSDLIDGGCCNVGGGPAGAGVLAALVGWLTTRRRRVVARG